MWYRGEITPPKDSSNKLLVHFVDYGNTELVVMSHIYQTP